MNIGETMPLKEIWQEMIRFICLPTCLFKKVWTLWCTKYPDTVITKAKTEKHNFDQNPNSESTFCEMKAMYFGHCISYNCWKMSFRHLKKDYLLDLLITLYKGLQKQKHVIHILTILLFFNKYKSSKAGKLSADCVGGNPSYSILKLWKRTLSHIKCSFYSQM